MADPESPPWLSELRAEAASLRHRADAIDKHIVSLVALVGAPAEPAPKAPRPSFSTDAATRLKAHGERVHKGKAPGTLTNRWKDHFFEIARQHQTAAFELELVRKLVEQREHRDVKPSQLKRLFAGYIAHDYLVEPSRGRYRLTDHLLDKIGFQQDSEGSPETTEEPSDGGVAERSNAADSKSAGAGLAAAPGGSNPSTTAPFRREEPTGTSTLPFQQPPAS